MKLIPIGPTGALINTSDMKPRARQQLQRDCLTVINRVATYPPQEETDYVRSGDLGRGWQAEVQGPGEILVVNRTVKTESRYRTKKKGIVTRHHAPRAYAKYVQGPHDVQSGVMAEKGWESIEDIADEVFGEQEHVYTQLLSGE